MSLRRALAKASPSHIPSFGAGLSYLLYADRAVIAINKPSGLVCQSDKSYEIHGRKSPFDQLLRDLRIKFGLDDVPKQVHRLDKYTTGVYLLAKSNTHARALSVQFREHSLKKTYLAIARGGRKTFPDVACGSINAPLRIGGEKVLVDERDGNPSLTDWELLGSSDIAPLSLLRLTLHSGVKHQLRVHLASVLKAPVLGDTLYSSKAPPKSVLDIIPKGVTVLPQQILGGTTDLRSKRANPCLFLHSARIDLTRYRASGPSKRLALGISAPLPSHFLQLCKAANLSQYVPKEYFDGSVTVDGVPIARDEEVSGLGGRWVWGEHGSTAVQTGLDPEEQKD